MGGVAQPLLGEDDAAFGVDRLRIELQPFPDLPEQGQTGVERSLVGPGEVEHVDRLLVRGERVGVGSELQALPLQHVHDIAVGDVGAAAERHMLEEVSEPLLLVPLLERAGADAHAHGDAVARRLIVHDRVAQAVGQHAEADARIGLAAGIVLCPATGLLQWRLLGEERRGRGKQQRSNENAIFHEIPRNPSKSSILAELHSLQQSICAAWIKYRREGGGRQGFWGGI